MRGDLKYWMKSFGREGGRGGVDVEESLSGVLVLGSRDNENLTKADGFEYNYVFSDFLFFEFFMIVKLIC